MAEYHAVTGSIIVKPVGEPIFSEQATHISLADEAAGPFVQIVQHGGSTDLRGAAICANEWPLIRKAVDEMLAVAKEIGDG